MRSLVSDPRHSRLLWRLFDLGFGRWRARRMMPTRFGGAWPVPTNGRPVLVVANHVSWWDGFLLREVQRRLRPDAPFFTVVVAEQIERHPGLERLGGVPVTPSSPSSVLRMLRTVKQLRDRDVETVFAYFPQGRIWPTSRRPLAVRRGVEAVARALSPVDIVPVSIHIEPLASARPTPFVWIGRPIVTSDPGGRASAIEIEARLVQGLARIRERLDRWGEEVVGEWSEANAPPRGLDVEIAPQLERSAVPAPAPRKVP